ncbi:hypothetical protein AVEN_191889-1 [Araneus ventricosus]|uniref:Uncharacterized protein n=1 Tax=Araneus ventricosus TaxID=182803 RepID=A0A4Y2K8S0_ARAVE|nr:hypothetical protein AVEN_191889-1 [Araneus ventricosus]
MKPFDFKYGRKQETDEENEENEILTEKSEYEDFDSFQQGGCRDGGSIEKSHMVDFSTNVFVSIDNDGGARMKAHCSYVYGIQEVDGGKYVMTGLRTINLAKSKFVSVVMTSLLFTSIS